MKTIKNPFRITIEHDGKRFDTYKVTVEEKARVVSDENGGSRVVTDLHAFVGCGFVLLLMRGGGSTVFTVEDQNAEEET